MRAAIDTSSWVSAVLSRTGRLSRIYAAFAAGRFSLVTSEPAFAETLEVLERPHVVRTGEARMAARTLLAVIRSDAEFVPITGQVKICRDPNDDMVIETALLGGVDVLVTEDHDLLEDPAVIDALAAEGVRVLRLAQFLAELEQHNRRITHDG